MNNNLGIIIRREFREPCGNIFPTPSDKTIAVIDDSGIIMPVLKQAGIEHLTFVEATAPKDSCIASESYYGLLTIPADIVDNPSSATFFIHEGGSVETESSLRSLIKDAVRDQRMQAYEIANLQQLAVTPQTIRVDETGQGEATSSALSFGIGLFMTFILYMFLLMYGQLVMTSIIEEKNNRVLELVVSSVRPVHLMLGKIFGVGLVAVLQ